MDDTAPSSPHRTAGRAFSTVAGSAPVTQFNVSRRSDNGPVSQHHSLGDQGVVPFDVHPLVAGDLWSLVYMQHHKHLVGRCGMDGKSISSGADRDTLDKCRRSLKVQLPQVTASCGTNKLVASNRKQRSSTWPICRVNSRQTPLTNGTCQPPLCYHSDHGGCGHHYRPD